MKSDSDEIDHASSPVKDASVVLSDHSKPEDNTETLTEERSVHLPGAPTDRNTKERSSSMDIVKKTRPKKKSFESNSSIKIPALRLKYHQKSNYPKISDLKEAEEAGFAGVVNLQKKQQEYQEAGIIQEYQLEIVTSDNNGIKNC